MFGISKMCCYKSLLKFYLKLWKSIEKLVLNVGTLIKENKRKKWKKKLSYRYSTRNLYLFVTQKSLLNCN